MGFTTIEVERFAGGIGTIEASDDASGSCVQNGSESPKVERAEAMRSKRSGERCRPAAQMTPSVFSRSRSSAVIPSSSPYTSPLCCPRSGAALTSTGESSSRTGHPGIVNSPRTG